MSSIIGFQGFNINRSKEVLEGDINFERASRVNSKCINAAVVFKSDGNDFHFPIFSMHFFAANEWQLLHLVSHSARSIDDNKKTDEYDKMVNQKQLVMFFYLHWCSKGLQM